MRLLNEVTLRVYSYTSVAEAGEHRDKMIEDGWGYEVKHYNADTGKIVIEYNK